MTHRGEILILETGLIVTVEPKYDAHSYVARIIWAPEGSAYPPGGHDIAITERDIAGARTVSLTADMAAALVAASEPTIESKWVVLGKKFEAPMPGTDDADGDEDEPKLLWTITNISRGWITCTTESGETHDFDYRAVAKARVHYRFQHGFLHRDIPLDEL